MSFERLVNLMITAACQVKLVLLSFCFMVIPLYDVFQPPEDVGYQDIEG